MLKLLPLLAFILLPMPSLSSALELRQQGLELREQQRWPEAIEALERSVALSPQDPTGYVILGWTQHLANNPQAAPTLWQALRLDAWLAEAANALGIVYLVRGELRPAILVHSWATLIKPQNKIAHYNLSLAFHRSQLYDWAISHGELANLLEPTNTHPIVALAIVHWSRGDRDRAIALYNDAIALDGEYTQESRLARLTEAGFSTDQIALANQIRLQL